MKNTFLKIVLLAFVLRLALALTLIVLFPGDRFDTYVDVQGYQLLAHNLIEGRGFSGSEDSPFTPDTKRTPGFPIYLALLYLLFGYSAAPFLIVNSLIGALTCGLAYLLLRRLLNEKYAMIAAFLLCLDVESILAANYMITEALYTFFLLASLLHLVKYLQENRFSLLVFSALLFALNVYVRPSGLILAVLIFLASAVYFRFRGAFSIRALLIGVALLLVGLAPWYIRNAAQVGRFEFSSAGESRVYRYWTRAFAVPEARRNGITLREQLLLYLDAETRAWLEENPDFVLSDDGMPISDYREYEYLKRVKPIFSGMIRSHLPQVIVMHLLGSVRAVFTTILDGFYLNVVHERLGFGCLTVSLLKQIASGNVKGGLTLFFSGKHVYLQIIALLWSYVHYLLAAFGLFLLIKTRNYLPALLFSLIILYHFTIGGIEALPRFRVPAMPFLLAFSAVALTRLLKLDKDDSAPRRYTPAQ